MNALEKLAAKQHLTQELAKQAGFLNRMRGAAEAGVTAFKDSTRASNLEKLKGVVTKKGTEVANATKKIGKLTAEETGATLRKHAPVAVPAAAAGAAVGAGATWATMRKKK